MFKFPTLFEEPTEEFLYKFLTQEEIFERYLGIPIQLNKKLISPLRNDRRPTATFGWRSGVLFFTDWNGEFSGNCISLVAHINNMGYKKAIKKIASDFNLIGSSIPTQSKRKAEYKQKKQEVKQFQAVWGDLEFSHISYFKSFGISIQTLKKYNVYKLKALWMNSSLIYVHTSSDPAVLYLEDDWFKAYYFKRKSSRFISQGQGIQGLKQLRFQSNKVIIQKSLKDVMLMDELGFESIAPPSENSYLSELQIRMLQDKYQEVVVIMDDDPAGNRALEHYRSMGLRTEKIPKLKDATDYCREFGLQKTETLLNNLIYVHS
jgi:hypothetical protein